MQKALEKNDGPCVILAGAGTGKTYTIVEKVKKLIAEGFCKPEEIVCITFSNEAANSLKSRIQKELNINSLPSIATFHAFATDLLRKYGESIGIKDSFSILTPDDAKVLFHTTLRVTPYYCHKYTAAIGMAKDMGIRLEDVQEYVSKNPLSLKYDSLIKELETLQFELQTLYLSRDKAGKSSLEGRIAKLSHFAELQKFIKAWTAYEKIKKKQNSYDYADLALHILDLFACKPELAKLYSYVIVDEFQDTNKLQLDFLFVLAPHKNIMIVGDMNQSIYRFRGAYRENFKIFKQHFLVDEEDIFNLNKSYRCPNVIGRVAHQLISKNYENPSECFSVENAHGLEGDKIKIFELENAHEEARKTIEIIQEENALGHPLEDICIMFRTHQQGRILRKTLDNAKIPFTSVSEKSLLQIPAIKVVIDYATILDCLSRNKKGGEQAWWDLVYRLHFSEKDLIVIGKAMKERRNKECLSQELIKELQNLSLSENGKKMATSLSMRIKELAFQVELPLAELFEKIFIMAGIVNENENMQNPETIAIIRRFIEVVRQHSALYGSELSIFMHYLETLRQLGIELEAPALAKPGVRLMTLHATKGLEYPIVIITNFAEKRFPLEEVKLNSLVPLELLPEFRELSRLDEEEREIYVHEYEKRSQLLEERRLCYVAFTRTKKRLYITYAKEYGSKKTGPSFFMNEINYRDNADCLFKIDNSILYKDTLPELKPAIPFTRVLNAPGFEDLLPIIASGKKKQEIVFSPSSLLIFSECQKRYEYKYVYQMPEEKTISWEALKSGSFIHLVLEHGVKNGFISAEQFLDYAREMHLLEEWTSLDMREIEQLINIFFARNKKKYSSKSLTEQNLNTELGGFRFIGFADRIDVRYDGLEIVDYKTGKQFVSPKNRNWPAD